MTHDPLCINSKGPCCEWLGDCDCQCMCEFINEIRADEREKVMAEGPYFTSVVHDCCVQLEALLTSVRGDS